MATISQDYLGVLNTRRNLHTPAFAGINTPSPREMQLGDYASVSTGVIVNSPHYKMQRLKKKRARKEAEKQLPSTPR